MNVQGVGMAAGASHMSGASAKAPPQQKMTNLYNQIDSSGSGTITQAQFNQAFQTMNPPAAFQNAGASHVWDQLDPRGSGQVSKQDFISGMKSMMVDLRRPAGGGVAQTASTTLGQLGKSSGIIA
jgi:hypothetical protein